MKKSVLLFFVGLLLFLFSSLSFVIAQQSDTCPADTHQSWVNVATVILAGYEGLVTSTDGDIGAVASLQEQRRQLDQTPRPPCDDQAYEVLHNAFDLAADSIVAALNGNNVLAQTLLSQANSQKINAATLITGSGSLPAIESPHEVGTITLPEAGAQVQWTEQVQGTYDPVQLGSNDLWLFVLTLDGSYYPQVSNACSDDRATIDKLRHNNWSMRTYFGAQNGNVGDTFGLDLMMGTADATAALYAMFPGWCPNSFIGLTQTQIDDLGFIELDYVEVVRK